jgi:short subunit dehydrogenase-like uncharacterized protein
LAELNMKTLLIYGATGYTGRMVAQHSKDAGVNIVLAGRNADELAKLATSLGVQFRVFSLDSPSQIDTGLEGVAVLLNCAGPFKRTAPALIDACIRTNTHYLDVAAELDSYQLAEELDSEAIAAKVMLLPGSGGSVAMLGCLASKALRHVANPASVRIALQVAGPMSRGSAISAGESLAHGHLERVAGALVDGSTQDLQPFDFGHGPANCFPVTLPDLITIWRTQPVPNIATFVRVAGDGFGQMDPASMPDGPSLEERRANRYQAVVEVSDAAGNVRMASLDTVNGYTFTAMAAAEAGRRVLAGEIIAGFQTPAGLFGDSFAESIADTTITVA